MNNMKCNDDSSLLRPRRGQRRRLTPGLARLIGFSLALGGWAAAAHAQQDATAVAHVDNGSLTGIVVTFGGSGYGGPPDVALVAGGGTGASAVAQVSGGAVTDIIVTSPGSGYTNAPMVAIAPPPPPITPATLNLSFVPELTVTGQAWQVEEIQCANTLGDTNQWHTLTNIVMGDRPCQFFDAGAPPGARFYRVVTLGAPGPDPARWAWINPGTFTMGSPSNEWDSSADEYPQTDVTFTNGFWMERFEVTEWEYTAVVGSDPSINQSDSNQPAENVSWFDASNYCAWLTSQEQQAGRLPAGYIYRLPTEAEWEYAYRAGTTTTFPFGEDRGFAILPDYSWFSTNGIDTNLSTHVVGQLRPNPWGIYDLGGNVWEWCADYYNPYPGGSVTNPINPPFSTNGFVMRGGSAFYPPDDDRCASRNFNPPDFQSHGIGIRVVLAPPLH
jgi:formylglycine-generating enzyme required for sulfatase activity